MFKNKEKTFQVVANHEEQYSVWPEQKEVPDGWVAVGPTGSKEECLDYVERVWTDMRPRSLRLEESAPSEEAAEGDTETLRSAVGRTLRRYEDRVEEYADGRPELFGWFVARVLETVEKDELDPDAIRLQLNAQLPETVIPDDYA